MNKSTIIKDLQDMLSESLPNVKYIDKDLGQLDYEQPPVGWPCILIDILEMDIRHLNDLNEKDSPILALTVANKRSASGSAHAPRASKEKSYETLDLTDQVHRLVQNFSAAGAEYTPLNAESFRKLSAQPGVECYLMTYKTHYNNNLGDRVESNLSQTH